LILYNRDQITARRRPTRTKSSSAKNRHERRSGPEKKSELGKRSAAEMNASLPRLEETGARGDG